MAVTAFGASVGSGPLRCVLLDVDDGHVVGREARTIDPGVYRFGRRGDLLTSGYDLLTARGDRPVDAVAVAARTRRSLLAARLGARGNLRVAEVVREVDAIKRALDETGVIARYATAMVVDVGAGGIRAYTIDVADGGAVADERSTRFVAGVDPGRGSAFAAGEFVRSAIDGSERSPEAIVLVGGGALHEVVCDAVADAARSQDVEVVAVDDPEALAATGAALLAIDRRTGAVSAPPARLATGFAAVGGHSVRLTAAVMPALVVAALTITVMIASYMTGIIGSAGEATADRPTSTAADSIAVDATDPVPVVRSSLSAIETPVSAAPLMTTDASTPSPTMTTFAPVPTMTHTSAPVRPSTSTPATSAPVTSSQPVPPSSSGAPTSRAPSVSGSPSPSASSDAPTSRTPGGETPQITPVAPTSEGGTSAVTSPVPQPGTVTMVPATPVGAPAPTVTTPAG